MHKTTEVSYLETLALLMGKTRLCLISCLLFNINYNFAVKDVQRVTEATSQVTTAV